MRIIVTLVTTVGLLVTLPAASFAESSTVKRTPGHLMQQKGSVPGEPGASGYAPGHLMQNKGSKKGSPGASGWAPGHDATTGQGTRRRD